MWGNITPITECIDKYLLDKYGSVFHEKDSSLYKSAVNACSKNSVPNRPTKSSMRMQRLTEKERRRIDKRHPQNYWGSRINVDPTIGSLTRRTPQKGPKPPRSHSPPLRLLPFGGRRHTRHRRVLKRHTRRSRSSGI
jgi:hypothetical protein